MSEPAIDLLENDLLRHHERIGAILESGEWTVGEKAVVKWQFRLLGDFRTALFKAIALADDKNLVRLAMGFPDEVSGFMAWNRGGLGKRLRDAGLEI